ncbi:OprD family outer membrane porin [Sulfurimonas sp.]|uniref:OprD family outer membrane porin n=1 Tax=Sulfurimonas sp. TaxID=2022749 RepID=UPI002B45C2AF|nr:OprD family outer membrane porin [Sulfurimonas sp.]
MKNNIALSAIVVGLLGSVSVQADDAVSTMFKNGKASGQIREFTIVRDTKYSNPVAKADKNQMSNAIGGYLKYVTAEASGFTLGTAFYTTNAFLARDNDKLNNLINTTVLGADGNGYSILGEAYIQYKNGKTAVTVGRQKIDSPLMAGDDYRMIRNLFNSVEIVNTSVDGVKFNLGHTTQMAAGTFANAYAGGLTAAAAGYTSIKANRGNTDFEGFGDIYVGESTAGITTLGVTYTGIKGLKVQLWDYYAHDISNTIYGDISYKAKMGSITPFVAAQFIKQGAAGDKKLKNTGISDKGELEGFYYGLKAGLSVSGFTTYLAYSATSENSDSDLAASDTAKNSIILVGGGYPVYTQGMVSRQMTLAGVSAIKAVLAYSFKEMGADVKVVGYYIGINYANSNAGYNEKLNTNEKGFDIIYNTAWAKNLQLRLRGNYVSDWTAAPNGTDDVRDWSEYRLIANYKF